MLARRVEWPPVKIKIIKFMEGLPPRHKQFLHLVDAIIEHFLEGTQMRSVTNYFELTPSRKCSNKALC